MTDDEHRADGPTPVWPGLAEPFTPLPDGPASESPPPDFPLFGTSNRRPLLVVGVAVAVILLGGVGVSVGVLLNGGSSSPVSAAAPLRRSTPAAAPPARPKSARTTTLVKTVVAPPPAPSSPESTSSSGSTAEQSYGAPGGLHVRGPAGWVDDRSAGVPTIRDYRDPASPQRLIGAFFRIGVSNDRPSGDFAAETSDAAKYLRSTYHARILAITQDIPFLDSSASDIEFEYNNAEFGVTRHSIERIWRSDGNTLIIQSSDVADRWPQTRALFDTMTAAAHLERPDE